jgi:hypothetical protein
MIKKSRNVRSSCYTGEIGGNKRSSGNSFIVPSLRMFTMVCVLQLRAVISLQLIE